MSVEAATFPRDQWVKSNLSQESEWSFRSITPLLPMMSGDNLACELGRQFQTRGGIYHGLNRYKPSCHKQVSDTPNLQNGYKQVLNNKAVWNRVSNT